MISFWRGIVLTLVAITGSPPEAGQRELENRFGWWEPRFLGLARRREKGI